jgi:hypothetical protein
MIPKMLNFSQQDQYMNEFNALISFDKQRQEQLNHEHWLHPFSPWGGLLVILFSDNTTIQTNWTKLASALEKMRRDCTRVVAILELTPTDDRQKDNQLIGGGLIPCLLNSRKEKYIVYPMTRMMNEQNGRVSKK